VAHALMRTPEAGILCSDDILNITRLSFGGFSRTCSTAKLDKSSTGIDATRAPAPDNFADGLIPF
jgi:hypothetical protein